MDFVFENGSEFGFVGFIYELINKEGSSFNVQYLNIDSELQDDLQYDFDELVSEFIGFFDQFC